ncbi:unnamed protein product [Withania somnifera]
MGLYNSNYHLEATKFPCALVVVCFIVNDPKYAAHSTPNFSYQMISEATTLKHPVMLEHSLVGDG